MLPDVDAAAYWELAHANERTEHCKTKLELVQAEAKIIRLEHLIAEARAERDLARAHLGTALGKVGALTRQRAHLLDRCRALVRGIKTLIPLAEMGAETQADDLKVWEVKKLVT